MVDRVDHLKMAVNHIENRINLLDNKAGVLVAIQAGLLAVTAFVADKLFLQNNLGHTLIETSLLVLALFTVVVVGSLLQVIRPTQRFLSLNFKIGQRKTECCKILWPNMEEEPSETSLNRELDNWEPDDFEKELRQTLYTEHWLVFRKYNYYRTATLLAKVQLIAIIVFLLLAYVLRLVC